MLSTNFMGKLFIVATPIGNLADITLRVLETLKNADLILAEDTRTTQKLLTHYNIHGKKLLSFFEGNEDRRTPEVVNILQNTDQNIALVSESGMPLISDPGYKLVREAIKQNIPVEAIPGPTALTTALVVSGLPPNAFIFLGYLPRKASHVKKLFLGIKEASVHIPQVKTVIFYEGPHRLLRTLQVIKDVFGSVEIAVARELTKIHEETIRSSITGAVEYFTKNNPRGEFVILFTLERSSDKNSS